MSSAAANTKVAAITMVRSIWSLKENPSLDTAWIVLATLAAVVAVFKIRLYALRADSGFFVTDFLAELERRALPYVIAVRMNPHLRRTLDTVRDRFDVRCGPLIEAASTRPVTGAPSTFAPYGRYRESRRQSL